MWINISPCDCNGRYFDSSWLNKPTTPDQRRIEEYLSSLDLNNLRILHVGIGNSSLYKRFQHLNIDGISIMQNEIKYAKSIGSKVFLINKYSDELLSLGNCIYDIIIDNNLSSYACCKYHLLMMFRNYIAIMKEYGVILTDKQGLIYHGKNTFGLTYNDLVNLGKHLKLRVNRMTEFVYSIKKIKPFKEYN